MESLNYGYELIFVDDGLQIKHYLLLKTFSAK